jgi:hypothetical protein
VLEQETPRLTNDEVDARAATVRDVRVVAAAGNTEVGSLSRRDEVLRRGEGKRFAADGEREVAGRLGRVLEQASRRVGLAAGRGRELGVRRARDVDEGGAGVDDGVGGAAADRGAVVGRAGDGDPPVRLERSVRFK